MADVFDITPGLIERVDEYYRARCMANASLPRLAKKLEEGKATYDDAYKYAEAIGKARADAFAHEVSSDVLPDGRMYYNIADRLMTETLSADHKVVADYAAGVQELVNKRDGISLAAQTADLDKDKIKGFIEGICNAELFDDVAWKLGQPVVTHARSVVDDTVKKNAEFQGRAGIKATVIRNAAPKCCEWCSGIDGDYVYPNVPGEVFQRHDNCRCTVDYKGRRLTAYRGGTHSFRDQGEQERIEERKSYAEQTLEKQKEDHKRIAEASQIIDRFNSEYGIHIDSEVWDLDYESVVEGLQGIEYVIKEFPRAQSAFKKIGIMQGSDIMDAGYYGDINYNRDIYKTRYSVLYNHGLTPDNPANGLHPKGDNAFGSGAHEAGHLLEKAIIDLANGGESSFGERLYSNSFYAESIVNEAVNEVKKNTKYKIVRASSLKRQISRYALENDSECLAEAIADVSLNREAAAPLSKAIWDILKKELG